MRGSKNLICLLNCVITLVSGVLIYALLRENTYINNFIDFPNTKASSVLIDFLRFYLVDALWAYALTFALSIFINEIFSGIISTAFGTLWELSQLCRIVSGTFDILDIIMYLSASTIAVLIIYLYKRRNSL